MALKKFRTTQTDAMRFRWKRKCDRAAAEISLNWKPNSINCIVSQKRTYSIHNIQLQIGESPGWIESRTVIFQVGI